MNKKIYSLFVFMMISAMLLAACSSGSSNSSSTPGASTSGSSGPVSINAAGGTFPLPIYTEWIQMYQSVDPTVTINYQGIGSGGGKKSIIDNTVDFAGSDSLLKPEEYTAGKDLQMYPTVAGAIVPTYNLTGLSQPLTLDGKTLVGIFSGKIKKWNDPAISALNPGITLPDATITAVHRSDGSGTTEIFTKALSAFSADWKNSVGSGTSVQWPVDQAGNGVGGKGNQGVAAAVQNTPNSIGYVELSFAVANKLPYADMINKAGQKITANADSLTSAMNDFAATFTDKLTNTIVDGPGAKSWPIAGYTYLILHTTSMTDCNKAQAILKFFKWALTDPAAAQKAAQLGYSVLPDAVRTQVLSQMAKVTCKGTPVLPNP